MTESKRADEEASRAIADLISRGRAAEAATLAAELLRTLPSDTEAMRLHAIAQLQLGQRDDARALLTRALAIAPESIELLCNLGSVELARGDAASALVSLERALAIAPANPAVLLGLGNARRANGDLDGARDAYLAATRANANHAGAWLNLAAVELALGSADAAELNVHHA